MAGSVLLDTNAVIALLANDAALRVVLEGRKIYLPAVVLGELYYGAFKSAQVQANLDRIERFKSDSTPVPCDAFTAFYYGQLKHALQLRGRPTPENDIWIGALARQHALTVVTRDKHIMEFPDVALARW